MSSAERGALDTATETTKKELKRQVLLDGAIGLFNANGISGTNIADIAKRLGMARASLYHYVKDRSDLVFQCYQKSCDITARDLDEASRAESGHEKVLAFIEHALEPTRRPIAVLSEIESLDRSHVKLIRNANDHNIQILHSFIDEGIQDGSIRPVDTTLATQSIVGILAWSQLLEHWAPRISVEESRQRALDSMRLLLNRGVAVQSEYKFECNQSVEQFGVKLENAFDRMQARAIKKDLFLATASKMFNRAGIESTSIDSIAESLGVTKGALYHLFNDKNDLVAQCYERSFNLYNDFCDKAAQCGGNGLESSLTNSHLNIQAQVGSVSPLMPQPGFESLPTRQRTAFRKKSRAQNQAIANFLRIGITEGSVVPCDVGVVTHICAGAFGWIPKWLPDNQTKNAQTIADSICDILANGLSSN